jgi:hypothetical protein
MNITSDRDSIKRSQCIRRYNRCWARGLVVRARYWSRRAQYWTDQIIKKMTLNEQLSLAA